MVPAEPTVPLVGTVTCSAGVPREVKKLPVPDTWSSPLVVWKFAPPGFVPISGVLSLMGALLPKFASARLVRLVWLKDKIAIYIDVVLPSAIQ